LTTKSWPAAARDELDITDPDACLGAVAVTS
jgi:hypothetical protein